MHSSGVRANIRFPSTTRTIAARRGHASRLDASPAAARSMVLGNLAALLTGMGAFAVFVGSSYYATLFEHFGVEPSVLEIGQAERASMGVISVVAIVVTAFGSWRLFAYGVIAGIILTVLVITVDKISTRCRWRWVQAIRRTHVTSSAFDRAHIWSMRVAFVCVPLGLGLAAGRLAGDYDGRAYHNRIAAGLGCDYRFGPETIHGVLLGQDRARSLIVTATGLRVMDNRVFGGVAPTVTDCLDKASATPAARSLRSSSTGNGAPIHS